MPPDGPHLIFYAAGWLESKILFVLNPVLSYYLHYMSSQQAEGNKGRHMDVLCRVSRYDH